MLTVPVAINMTGKQGARGRFLLLATSALLVSRGACEQLFPFLQSDGPLSPTKSYLAECPSGQSCVSLVACSGLSDVTHVLERPDKSASETTDALDFLKAKLCQTLDESIKVCCDDSVALPRERRQAGAGIGPGDATLTFRTRHHGVSGRVERAGPHTLILHDFSYDGEGPDAFFVVGLKSPYPRPPKDVHPIIYPTPATGQPSGVSFLQRDIPVLGRFDKQTIRLDLPENIETWNIRWLSVYCRDFRVNFGHVIFPRQNDLPKN